MESKPLNLFFWCVGLQIVAVFVRRQSIACLCCFVVVLCKSVVCVLAQGLNSPLKTKRKKNRKSSCLKSSKRKTNATKKTKSLFRPQPYRASRPLLAAEFGAADQTAFSEKHFAQVWFCSPWLGQRTAPWPVGGLVDECPWALLAVIEESGLDRQAENTWTEGGR